MLLLLSCLLVFPGGVFLNRGNHEDTVMNARYLYMKMKNKMEKIFSFIYLIFRYGFIREVHQKYKVSRYDVCTDIQIYEHKCLGCFVE